MTERVDAAWPNSTYTGDNLRGLDNGDPLSELLKLPEPGAIAPMGRWMGYSMGSNVTERRVGELEQGIRAVLAALDGCYSTDAKAIAIKILQSIPGFAPDLVVKK